MLGKWSAVGVVFALGTGALSGCGSSGGDTASGKDCTVNSAVVANLTGAGSQNGQSVKAGVDVAAEVINENGGINGCKLDIDYIDDGSDYTKALPLVQAAMAKKKYANVTAADFSAASIAPYLTRQKVLGIFDNGTKGLPGGDNPYVFDVCPTSASVVEGVVKSAVAAGNKNLAVVADNTSNGQSVIDQVKQQLAAAGGKVVTSEQVDLSSVNMTPAVQRLRASGADSILVSLYGAAGGYFFRDLAASGWKPKVYGSQSVFATNLAALVPEKDIDGILAGGAAAAMKPNVNDDVQTLIDKLKANGVDLQKIGLWSALAGYATQMVFAFGANGANSTEAEAITKYLEENGDEAVPHFALAKTTGYSADNHEMHAPGVLGLAKMAAFDENGQLKRVETLN